MKKTISKKLVVSSTSIRNLTGPDLVRAAGGVPPEGDPRCTFGCTTGKPPTAPATM
jgi:hypothetical protein